MLKTGRETLKRLLLALLLAALCPLFAYSQDAGSGAESNVSTDTPPSVEGAAQERPASELELRFDGEGGGVPQSEAVAPVAEFTIWDFVRMVLVLGFVVALIYGLFYLLKRSQGASARESGVIDVVATQTLPGNGMVHLVRVGTQLYMLGSSEHSLRLLTEIDNKESRDEIELTAARQAAQAKEERRSFSDLMSAMASSLTGIGRSETQESPEAETGESENGAAAAADDARAESSAPRMTEAGTPAERTTAEARAEQEVLDFISSQRQRLRRLNS